MNQVEEKIQEFKNISGISTYRKWRISLAILTVIICSVNIHMTNTQTLRHSRDLHRALNKQILLHDDLDIYWFGYRVGQYLISYPIQQYYFPEQFSQFLKRMEQMMGNLQFYTFGFMNQRQLNQTTQKIIVKKQNGKYQSYDWKISKGITEPFRHGDLQSIKHVLVDSKQLQIIINVVEIGQNQQNLNSVSWSIIYLVQTFSQTSIFVSIYLQQKISLAPHHIPHFIIGLVTCIFLAYQIRKRQTKRIQNNKKDGTRQKQNYRFDLEDLPDFLICFFLLYSSFSSFTHIFSPRFILLLDGITCFICWLYILKLYTQNDNYHISFLIRKSYLLVGRLFASFGPLFIGFCLFALTVFCRYSKLFDDFHKTFISIFCICYYNMTYEQFRTTQRTNPISAIFFSLVLMLFTICIYSGMLVSVFCSYMWNKKQEKNKKQLMQLLKIQCVACNNKYGYEEGYRTSIQMSISKTITENIDSANKVGKIGKLRKYVGEITKLVQNRMKQLLNQSKQIMDDLEQNQEQEDELLVEKQYFKSLKQIYVKTQQLMNQLESDIIIE